MSSLLLYHNPGMKYEKDPDRSIVTYSSDLWNGFFKKKLINGQITISQSLQDKSNPVTLAMLEISYRYLLQFLSNKHSRALVFKWCSDVYTAGVLWLNARKQDEFLFALSPLFTVKNIKPFDKARGFQFDFEIFQSN